MTKVVYKVGNTELEGSADNPIFLLTNNIGGYTSFSNQPISWFQGIFFNDKFNMFKVVENIIPLDTEEPSQIMHSFYKIDRFRGNLKEEFIMPKNKDAIIYTLSEEKTIKLNLDCRRSYDPRQYGRFYQIYKQDNKIIIEFHKRTDEREDETHNVNEYKIYTVIDNGDEPNFEMIDEFIQMNYEFDKARGANPERHIYSALKLEAKQLIITFSTEKLKAIRENNEIKNGIKTLRMMEKNTKNIITEKNILKNKSDKQIQIAYHAACNSMQQLTNEIFDIKGIYAGLWWFFQFWSRDEAVSLKSVILQEDYETAKQTLLNRLKFLQEDGRLPNHHPPIEGSLGCADGVGWTWKRIGDLIEILHEKSIINQYLSQQELHFLKNKLETTIFGLLMHHTDDNFAVNKKLETWMDTDNEHDTRAGARIEIQALRLNMYELLRKLCNILGESSSCRIIEKREKLLLDKTRKHFFKDYLYDGLNDPTIRPNVFIAYYIYPNLLTKKQWEQCFDKILPRLWNEWGGLSSIDKQSQLYNDTYTGQDNKSYHRGDSWYWINNLAAICMLKLNKSRYKKYINQIIKASTHEILWNGIIGSASEVSSSKQLESQGCLCQAWSNAMYIELIEELK